MNVDYWNKRAIEQGEAAVSRKDADAVAATAGFRRFFERHYPDFGSVTGNVLDFGCGWGRWAPLFENAEFYIGLDTSAEMIELAYKRATASNARFAVTKADKISCDDGYFDLAWICTVLQHIIEDEDVYRALSEVHRVLKPGGIILMFENTSTYIERSAPHVKFRSGTFYQDALHGYDCEHLGALEEAGERHDFMMFTKATT